MAGMARAIMTLAPFHSRHRSWQSSVPPEGMISGTIRSTRSRRPLFRRSAADYSCPARFGNGLGEEDALGDPRGEGIDVAHHRLGDDHIVFLDRTGREIDLISDSCPDAARSSNERKVVRCATTIRANHPFANPSSCSESPRCVPSRPSSKSRFSRMLRIMKSRKALMRAVWRKSRCVKSQSPRESRTKGGGRGCSS